mgnify:CR=1 FL=1
MKQIKAHIAVSLDGHTATLDQELDWLPDEVKTIIGKHYMVVDSLLMGANTVFFRVFIFIPAILCNFSKKLPFQSQKQEFFDEN